MNTKRPTSVPSPGGAPPPAEPPIDCWLSPKQVAGYFGLTRSSTYRWINEGLVPAKFVRFCGRRQKRLHPAAVPLLEREFASGHER